MRERERKSDKHSIRRRSGKYRHWEASTVELPVSVGDDAADDNQVPPSLLRALNDATTVGRWRRGWRRTVQRGAGCFRGPKGKRANVDDGVVENYRREGHDDGKGQRGTHPMAAIKSRMIIGE